MLQILGFGMMMLAIYVSSVPWLLAALATVVAGFSFMQPNLHALISRRSDPAHQGMVLGVAQSVNSLARILGAGLGIPMLRLKILTPYGVAALLMALGLALIIVAVRTGDYVRECQWLVVGSGKRDMRPPDWWARAGCAVAFREPGACHTLRPEPSDEHC